MKQTTKEMLSKVMTIANSLVKQGISRSAAMVKAWIMVKLHNINTKAVGVTRDNRQGLLDRLNRYTTEQITIDLQREASNEYDKNAIQIVVGVIGKGKAVIGYINRDLASLIAPIMDKGKTVKARFDSITGGHEYRLNYGLNVVISL